MLSLPILAGLKSVEFCVILHHSPESSSKHAVTAYHLLLGRWPPMRKHLASIVTHKNTKCKILFPAPLDWDMKISEGHGPAVATTINADTPMHRACPVAI